MLHVTQFLQIMELQPFCSKLKEKCKFIDMWNLSETEKWGFSESTLYAQTFETFYTSILHTSVPEFFLLS